METETLSWVCPVTAALHELDVTPDQAERMTRGEVVPLSGARHRRYSAEDGIARLTARRDQIDARLSELVNEYPALKSCGRSA